MGFFLEEYTRQCYNVTELLTSQIEKDDGANEEII